MRRCTMDHKFTGKLCCSSTNNNLYPHQHALSLWFAYHWDHPAKRWGEQFKQCTRMCTKWMCWHTRSTTVRLALMSQPTEIEPTLLHSKIHQHGRLLTCGHKLFSWWCGRIVEAWPHLSVYFGVPTEFLRGQSSYAAPTWKFLWMRKACRYFVVTLNTESTHAGLTTCSTSKSWIWLCTYIRPLMFHLFALFHIKWPLFIFLPVWS